MEKKTNTKLGNNEIRSAWNLQSRKEKQGL